MEHAKKMILVEPRLLEQLQVNNEYKEIQKPADKKTKTSLSMDMQNVFERTDIDDDIKAKLYQQALSRFLSVNNEIPPPRKVQINTSKRPPLDRKGRRQSTRKYKPSLQWSPC